MSLPISIVSTHQFTQLLRSTPVVIADFYADWCGPCKAIAPQFEAFSKELSQAGKVVFAKINVDEQQELAKKYQVTAMPTFVFFKNTQVVQTVRGADTRALGNEVKKVAAATGTAATGATTSSSSAAAAEEGSGDGNWMGASAPKGYPDITSEIELKGTELLNCDDSLGSGRVLFESSKPSALNNNNNNNTANDGKAKSESTTPDWVESDTDEQLMIFIPFHSILKVHSLHVTSLPARDEDEAPMRPKTLKVYINRTHIIGFDEADDVEPTQTIVLEPRDWDEKTGTAKAELRFVKFQRVSSLVVYVVDGDGDEEKVRIDRLRVFGEAGEKRDMGKLEKVGEEAGE